MLVHVYNPSTGPGSLRQEDWELEASLDYRVRLCLKKQTKNQEHNKQK
jgi:hypothetical protein